MASYRVNPAAVAHAERLIDARQYVLRSDWGRAQPRAEQENAFLESHSWEQYGGWHLGLTDGAADETKARYGFVYGDFPACTGWGSSRATTARRSGATRKSSSPRTSCCNGWTRS